MICLPETVKVSSDSISVKFTKSPFFKGELAENQTYMLSVGLQIKPVKINRKDDFLEIVLEKPVAYRSEQIAVLLKPDSEGIRIVGKGLVQ